MGESIKIRDLIYKMIKLSGFSVKDDNNINGDIELKITGLRPGEKLYEEILNSKELTLPTEHPKLRVAEAFVELKAFHQNLTKLLQLNADDDLELYKKVIKNSRCPSRRCGSFLQYLT
mgnify:CR=1 FL=1